MRILLCIVASKSWTLNSLDIKSAFLQGEEIDRIVYIEPPPEANTNKLWQLRKCVYGLSDAPRRWYVKLRNELVKLGVAVSEYDSSLFYFRKGSELIGIMACHVDDIVWGGTNEFRDSVIAKVCQVFQISKKCTQAFQYIGINMSQKDDGSIHIDQSSYANRLSFIELSPEAISDKDRSLKEKEKSILRQCVN